MLCNLDSLKLETKSGLSEFQPLKLLPYLTFLFQDGHERFVMLLTIYNLGDINSISKAYKVFNRPGVAGAVL